MKGGTTTKVGKYWEREMQFPAGKEGDTSGAGEQQIALVALFVKTVPAPED